MELIVAGGTGPAKLAYSYDGVHWLNAENPDGLFEHGACLTITHNGLIWVAGGTGLKNLGYSEDGITWRVSHSPLLNGGSFITIAWNGTYFIASGDDEKPPPDEQFFFYSTDGKEWTTYSDVAVLFNNSCNAIASNGELWVAGGNGSEHRMGFSTDGRIWTPSSSGNDIFMLCCAIGWNGSMWVAGGMNGLAYSQDGMNWVKCDIQSFVCLTVAWNGSLWVAGGEGAYRIAYSVDGIHWTFADSPFHNSVVCVIWTSEEWFAGGGEIEQVNIARSADGIHWTDSTCAVFGSEGSCRAFGIKKKQ